MVRARSVSPSTRSSVRSAGVLAVGGVALTATALLGAAVAAPTPSPAENPQSEAKRVLGKILFWDEQLSSDDTVACGTCHLPTTGGADPRRVRNPGPDGVSGTSDDVFGSPGVIRQDANGNYLPHASFGTERQVTGRSANSVLTGGFANDLFWDGRAKSQFVDPQTNSIRILSGGALESQAVGPILNTTEMSRAGRTWAEVAAKLASRAPLALATNLPADVGQAIDVSPTYPELFAAAFGDPGIDAARIAFAIASYERTLTPDQTPWDRFDAGDVNALTPQQQRGWQAFRNSRCNDCHTAPEFTDRSFRAIGVRPHTEDSGLMQTTGLFADRGKFKVPSLRNVGLRRQFMHGGQLTTLTEVSRFYARAPGVTQFTENQDPILPQINLPPQAAADVEAFLAGGLTDPRAATGQFPFDRPTLFTENTARTPALTGSGRAGSGLVVPRIVAVNPPFLGNDDFRIGVSSALGGATAYLAVATTAPVNGEVAQETLLGPITLDGTGSAEGYATLRVPIPADPALDGAQRWYQWRVTDGGASGGVALSPAAQVRFFAVRTAVPAAPEVTDDGDLFVSDASFTVDWRSHGIGRAADTLTVRGILATAGAGASFENAVVTVSFEGTTLAVATLDAKGRAVSARGATPSFDVRADAATGRCTITLGGLDLRDETGLNALSGAGRIERTVTLSVTGAGLATETSAAEVPFAWATKEGRTTRGTHRYVRDGLGSGVFRPATTAAKTVRVGPADAVRLRTAGALSVAGGALVPTTDLNVSFGDATHVVLPASSLRIRNGASMRWTGTAGASEVALTLDTAEGTFALAADGLPAGLLPADADAAIPVVVATRTAAGAVEFRTTLRILAR